MPDEIIYNLYPYMPPELQGKVDDVVARIRELRGDFQAWAKDHSDADMRYSAGVRPPTSARLRIPDEVGKKLFSRVLIPQVLNDGKMPEWCTDREGYHITLGSTYNSGVFCIFYGRDPDTKQWVVFLQQRKEKQEFTNAHALGAFGGYIDKYEQSTAAVIREAMEELPSYGEYRNWRGEPEPRPLLEVDQQRLALIYEGRDYENKPFLQYSAYAYEMNEDEIRRIKSAMTDPAYIAKLHEHSHGETTGIQLEPIASIKGIGVHAFRYHRQYDAIMEVKRRLDEKESGLPEGRKGPSSPVGHTLGDARDTLHISHLRYLTDRTGSSRQIYPAY